MDLINKEVTHKVFGEGLIIDQESNVVTVDFKDDIKKFVYPDAFGQFIKLNDREVAKVLKGLIAKREAKQEELERKREEKREQEELERIRLEKLKNQKIHESSQIVFWLDEAEYDSVYEQWQISTGTIQSGKNKGEPNKAVRLRPNSATILTVRESEQNETERRITGLFMVGETFSGDLDADGMVPAHEQFRIKLTEEESEKMLFWNYYINKNYPHRTTWNSGRYRYYDNVWTAQIVKDIIELRTDEDKKAEVQKFLEYFCQMNVLDINDIPDASGALKQ